MKYFNLKSILFLILICLGTSKNYAQIVTGTVHNPGNQLDYFCCSCYSIIDACSGERMKSLAGAEFSVRCSSWWDERPHEVKVTVDQNGRICLPPLFKACSGTITACSEHGNWEICKVHNCANPVAGPNYLPSTETCRIYMYQTLTTNPRINGSLIGNGQSGNFGSSTFLCGRRSEFSGLNSYQSATPLKICPGDPVIFSMQGFSIPEESGMCLSVNIWEGDVRVATASFNHEDTNGSSIDFGNLFNGLSPNITYRIEFISHCCDRNNSTCTRNSRKFAYFRITQSLSFSEYGRSGFEPNTTDFLVATSPPSTLLQGGSIVPGTNIKVNQFTLNGFNVDNSPNSTINWNLKERDCITGVTSGTNLLAGSLTPQTGVPFDIGPILILATQDCQCYVLELQYRDECTGQQVSRKYYFKEGVNCPSHAIVGDDDEAHFRANSNPSNERVKLVQNPITQELKWDVDDSLLSETITLSIFDTTGKEIIKMTNVGIEVLNGMPFNEKTGLYFYQIKIGSQLFTGKFIKS